ncbi:MAG: LapA family protein [Cloacibacillus sp.]
MKSYILAIVVTMFLSALFAFQNIGEVTVRFLFFEWTLPQGVWEVVLFSSGAAIMWFFSLFSVFEVRSKYKKELKAKDEKIASLEQEKKTILESLTMKAHTAPLDESETQQTGSATGTETAE